MWHLDGYDKLKPFGFAVHACIDGLTPCLASPSCLTHTLLVAGI